MPLTILRDRSSVPQSIHSARQPTYQSYALQKAAAGPAFEGARIVQGMRAATGAIWRMRPVGGKVVCEVLGNGEARGLCGNGLVDAVATGLDLGMILPSGRFAVSQGRTCTSPAP